MIPNLNDCKKIVSNNPSFIEKITVIDGYEITNYSYRLANYTDFSKPLAKSKVTGFELRGICFINDNKNNKSSNKRYLSLGKFFNLNQTENFMYKDVYNKKIAYVQDKCDGSLVRFIRLPNNRVISKTINSFDSDQALEAMKIYNTDSNIKNFVDFTLDSGLVALFEFLGPNNQIVLKYPKNELRLLAIRRESDGSYFHENNLIYNANLFKILYAEFFDNNITLDEYMKKAETEEGKEGWVITFEDGQKIKIKTKWYLSLHRIMTSVAQRDNDIINCVLNESIDDLISNIPEDAVETRARLTEISSNIIDYINLSTDEIYMKNLEYIGDKKTFAIANKSNQFFYIMMKTIEFNSKNEIRKLLIEYIKKYTSHLSDATQFIERIKPNENFR